MLNVIAETTVSIKMIVFELCGLILFKMDFLRKKDGVSQQKLKMKWN